MKNMEKIAFIGLGIMGIPMCHHLLDAGYRVFTYTRSHTDQRIIDAGAVVCSSPADAAQQADIIIMIVNDSPHVEQVLCGTNGVLEVDLHKKVVVDMSTISPLATKTFAAQVQEKGGDYLDAPVSGGDVGAKAASLSIMVGGSQTTFERVLPLFQCMGENISHIGEVGSGQITKMANQVVIAQAIQGVAEALVLASKAGADPEKVRQALMGGFANSRILEVHGKRMTSGNFTPGFKVNLHQKDMTSALNTARELGVNLSGAAGVQQLLSSSIAQGNAEEDHAAIVKVIEQLAQHSIR